VGIGIAGSIITVVTGAVQFWLGNVRADQERDLALGRVLLEHGPKIYSKDSLDRAFVIEVIKITSSNKTLTDTILGKFAAGTPDEAIKQQIRAAQTIVTGDAQSSPQAMAPPSASAASVGPEVLYAVRADKRPSGGFNFTIAAREGSTGIASIEYKINHPSFKKQVYVGDPSAGFAMRYSGWGAVDEVIARATLKSGRVESTSINMIRELGW
jgi:hypothetical protein